MTAVLDPVQAWNDEMEMASRLDGVPWVRCHAIAINGMGSQGNDIGFASDLCYALDPAIFWFTIIDYTAAAFPMGPSVKEGIEKVVACVLGNPGKTVLFGYSEGSLVQNTVWRDECLNPAGRLHQRYLAGDILCVVVVGDPMRCPGIARGNEVAGFPVPAPVDGMMTGGISGSNDLTAEETGEIVYSCSNDGDVYASAPVGDNPWTAISGVGHDMEIIFSVVQNFNGQNVFAIMTEVLKVLGIGTGGLSLYSILGLMQGAVQGIIDGLTNVPVTGSTSTAHVAYLVQAVMTFGMFVLKGLGPHGDYEKMIPAMAAKVNDIGRPFASV